MYADPRRLTATASRLDRGGGILAALILAAFSEVASPAQSISVTSITPSTPDLGRVVSAPSRPTDFRIAPTGQVTVQKGSGVRLTSGNATPALVKIRCGGGPGATCPSTTVTIQALGTPTGRAQALSNFTVAGGSNPPPMSSPKGKNTITFTIDGALKNTNYDFYVGMDFPIEGDDSSAPTGLATSSFSVSVPGSDYIGTAVATVFRPISVSQLSPLNFGMIARPRSGTGTVLMDPTTGAVSVTGSGSTVFSVYSPTRGAFLVSGEGGQAFSISVPPFDMKNKGHILTVSPSTSPSGSATLGGSAGASGNESIYVGGSFSISDTTPAGSYTGTVTMTVQYN